MAATSNRSDTYALDNTTHDTVAIATLAAALTAASGISLTRGRGVNCIVSAPSSRTISSGAMRCYIYAPVLVAADGSITTARWLAYPGLDFTPATSVRDAASGDMEAITGVLKIIWLPDALTVSGGTGVVLTVTMSVERWQM